MFCSSVIVKMIFFIFIEEEAKALVRSTGVLESLRLTCEASNVVAQLQERLELGREALADPGPETKRVIRSLSVMAKSENRLDVVKHLREITPAGITGVCCLFVCLFPIVQVKLRPLRMPMTVLVSFLVHLVR